LQCISYLQYASTGVLARFSSSSSSSLEEKVVLVMTQDKFTSSNVKELVSELTQGILVLNKSSSTTSSPAATTPNGAGTPAQDLAYDDNAEWNPNGNEIESLDLYGTPTMYVPDPTTSSYLLQVATEQQQQLLVADKSDPKSYIVAELKSYMGGSSSSAALTSEKCLSWRNTDGSWRPKCLPLGGQSVWATSSSTSSANAQVVYIAASMDGSSMFHDLAPSANAAASNILALLMAAKLVGQVDQSAFNKKIVFALFQGDSYGYMGSRKFFQDVSSNFKCYSQLYSQNSNKTFYYEPFQDACLYPLRPSLAFQEELSSLDVYGLLAVDQVGVLATPNTMYVHGHNAPAASSGNSNAFIANVLMQLTTSHITSVVEGDADNVPPTPLTSALKLSSSIGGGAVLAGYSGAGFSSADYRSHLDVSSKISLEAIASAATILARAAIAVSYDDGSENYATAAEYALSVVPELNGENSTYLSLSKCLLEDGNCDFLRQYVNVERANDIKRTGYDLGLQQSGLGTPPNYYVGVYGSGRQPIAVVGSNWYGAYDNSNKKYGQSKGDSFILSPNALETSIHGLLNDFLGRPLSSTSLKSCTTSDNCKDVKYCSSSEKEYAVCTGGLVCVCARAHYHVAVDEAFEVPVNNSTGYFVISDKDEGVSAMYTEPYWDEISARVYREGNSQAGVWTTSFAVVVAVASYGASLALKSSLAKEKLY